MQVNSNSNGAVLLNHQGATPVYGLNIENAHIAMLTKRVLSLALASVVLVIVLFTFQAVYANDTAIELYYDLREQGQRIDFDSVKEFVWASIVITLLLGLAVPFCGYKGAKSNDQNMLTCFCGCNFLCGACNGWTLLNFIIVLHHHYGFFGTSDFVILIQVVFILINCSSFWFGKELRRELLGGAVINSPPMVVYVSNNVQPIANTAFQPQAHHFQGHVPGVQASAPSIAPPVMVYVELDTGTDGSLGIQLDAGTLAIVGINPSGPVRNHNAAHPYEGYLLIGDRFVVVNGVPVANIEEYQSAVRLAPRLRATLARTARVMPA